MYFPINTEVHLIPDYSEVLLRVQHLVRSLNDAFNDKDHSRAAGLSDELLVQARVLQLVIKDKQQ